MSFTYDLGTAIGKLRLLITDTVEASKLFDDEELQMFLDDASGDKYFAGYLVYHTLIRNRALLAKRIKREGYESEQHAVADLRLIADSLKDQASSLEGVQTGNLITSDDHFENYRPTWRDTLTREVR